MSIPAIRWFSSLPGKDLSNSEFRVLFALCNCHNPKNGCCPSQAFLKDFCGLSNGTVNKVLKDLEANGKIARRKRWDQVTQRQKTTIYTFPFEKGEAEDNQSSQKGERDKKPSPRTGAGTASNSDHHPSPISGGSRLQPTGEVTCKEPANKQSGLRRGSKNPVVVAEAEGAVRSFKEGRVDAFLDLPLWVLNHIRDAEFLTPDERQSLGLFAEAGS